MTTEPAAHAALRSVLADTSCSYHVRLAAAEALGWQGGATSAAALLGVAQDADERVRIAAIRAMGDLKADMPVQTLLAALSDRDDVHKAAIEALKQLDERLSLEPLALALQNEKASVRVGVLSALARVRDLSSRLPIEATTQLLHDPDYQVRLAVVQMLGNFVDVRSLPPLLEAMNDDTPNPRPDKERYYEDIAEAAVNSLLELQKRLPDMRKWVTVEHLERAFLNKKINSYRLLELADRLHIHLSPEVLLSDLSEDSGDNALDKKVHQLTFSSAEAPLTRLLDMLSASSRNIQRRAARALLGLYQLVPVEPIAAWLQRIDVRSEAYSFVERYELSQTYIYLSEILARKGKEVDIEQLLYILENAHTDSVVEEGFVRICSILQAKAPIERLFGLLCDGIHAEECVHVLRSLYELLTPELIRAQAVHRRSDEIFAIQVLGTMQKEAPADLLMEILKDESRHKWVRLNALFTLCELGVAVPLEYFVLGQSWDEGVDYDMIEAMSRLGAEAPIPELVELLDYGHSDVKTGATRSLQRLAEYVPVDLLLTALESTNANARQGAAEVLSAFGERAPINTLLAIVRDGRESPYVREAALGTLTSLGFRTPSDLLLQLLQTGDPALRRAAFSALAAMGNDAPLDALLRLLDDKELRDDTIEILGSLEENAPVDLLLTLFDDEEMWGAASRALAKLGKYAPIEELLSRLYDEDGEMRWEIIELFGDMGEYAPVDVILKAFDSDNTDLRNDADMALFQLSEYAPARLVEQARDDPRPVVRRRVLDALAKLGQDALIEIALASLADEETRAEALSALVELKVDVSARMPKEMFLHLVRSEDKDDEMDWHELELLEQFGEQISVELLLQELGGGSRLAAEKLHRTYPAVFRELVAPQAEAILRGEPVGSIFASLVQSRIATAIGQIGRATPAVLSMVVDALDWPYRETRLEAVRALVAIHRNIPDRALRRLLELRHDPQSSDLRRSADVALAEILSYENGMEEEEV